jgi:hypothetical protein
MWRWAESLYALVAVVAMGVPIVASQGEVARGMQTLLEQPEELPGFSFFKFVCADRRPGAKGKEILDFDPSVTPYVLTRLESRTLPGSDNPTLTISADPQGPIMIYGKGQRDFTMQFCARGGGKSEAEARQRLGEAGMTLNKDVVVLNSPGNYDPGSLLRLEAPANAQIVSHSVAAVEIHDMSGPVRVAIPAQTAHGATLVNTTGQVDAVASTIYFASSRGRVTLTASSHLNLVMTATKFEGTLDAWAQDGIKMMLPAGFQTPFRVNVNHADDFVCRADICPQIKQEKAGALFVFTYPGDGSAPPERITARLEPVYLAGNRTMQKVVVEAAPAAPAK